MALINLECAHCIPKNILNYYGGETMRDETLINIIDDFCLSFKLINETGGDNKGSIFETRRSLKTFTIIDTLVALSHSQKA